VSRAPEDVEGRRFARAVAGRAFASVAVALAVAVVAACAPDVPEPEAEAATAIPEAPADVVQAADWSADGGRLAVAWLHGDRTRVYGLLAPFDATPPEPSTGLPITRGDGAAPSWSPDGLWLAFATTRDGNGEIYRVRPDGTGPENLTRDPAEDAEPAYAPGGGWIAFVSTRGSDTARVWVMDAEGVEARPLGGPQGAQGAPAWSPDGERVAVAVGSGAASAVWIVRVDDGGAERVGAGGDPSWAPGGDALYYARSDSVFARAPDGAPDGGDEPERFLTRGRAPCPSPDGRWLAFVRGDARSAGLWLLDLSSGAEARITS
jgi:Tol biopolymer transport system component